MGGSNGRRALVVGVANEHSIAWGVAAALAADGWRLAVTYLNEKAEPHVRPLAERAGAEIILPLDVNAAGQADALYATIAERWGGLDAGVHSIAFAPREDLHGRVADSSREGFAHSMDVSVHSFVRMARRCEPLMPDGGLLLTMSFHGAQKVVSTYNMMGPVKAALEAAVRELASELGEKQIRVNALSPGPMLTRAAGGIDQFDAMLEDARTRAPMRRLATIEDCGATALFLAGPGGRSITGATLYVDAGLNIMA
jgi:enoyl-[acyl-carrier protein] reductase I